MLLLRRHKWVLTGLVFYWPMIFIATHIPSVPKWVGDAQMSDKTMHFLSYLGLISLVWFTISPYEKVNWGRAKVWVVLAVMVWYGACDEWLQGFVGRQPEVKDFYADLGAVLLGLFVMTIFSFWGAVLAFSSILIFVITNITRGNVVFSNYTLNSAFYFLSYAFFTLVWIQFAERNLRMRPDGFKWLGVCTGVPVAVLAVMKVSSLAFGKSIWMTDILTALSAVAAAVAVSYVTLRCCRRGKALLTDQAS